MELSELLPNTTYEIGGWWGHDRATTTDPVRHWTYDGETLVALVPEGWAAGCGHKPSDIVRPVEGAES